MNETRTGEFSRLGCVIMASGVGSRFGGNTLMADFAGEPVIGRVLDAVWGIFGRCVVVTRNAVTAEYCRDRGAEVILHSLPGRNDTVRLGLERMAGTRGCIFCQGDQPLNGRDTLLAMGRAALARPEDIIRAAFGGEGGSPILFPACLYDELRVLPAGKGGGYVVKAHPHLVRLVEAARSAELADIDTREDLLALLAHFAGENA